MSIICISQLKALHFLQFREQDRKLCKLEESGGWKKFELCVGLTLVDLSFYLITIHIILHIRLIV